MKIDTKNQEIESAGYAANKSKASKVCKEHAIDTAQRVTLSRYAMTHEEEEEEEEEEDSMRKRRPHR